MTTYAGQYGPTGVEYPDGAHAISRAVSIRPVNEDSLATLYGDRFRSAIIANPVRTDEIGNLTFWAEPGNYTAEIDGHSFSVQVPEDPFEPDTALTPEEKQAMADEIASDVEANLEPPVDLVTLFENGLA